MLTKRSGPLWPVSRALWWLALAFAFAFALASPAQAQQTKVVVGLSFAVDHLPLLVAQDKGFFAKNNLDVELKNIPIPANIGPALASGDIQVGAGSAVSFLLAREAGLPFTVISGQTRNDKKNDTMGLVTRKGFSISRAQDLKGKKVAVPGLLSSGYVLMAKWLIDNGVALNEVTFLEIPMPRMGDLLRTGSADAIMAPDPHRARVVAMGAGDFSLPVVNEVSPDNINLFWIASMDWVSKNPAVPRAFKSALADGIKSIKDDPAGAREVEMKYVKFNNPSWPTYSTELALADLAFFHRIGREIGALKKDLDPKDIVQP
jgi:NitT/TauT family transport system substrate-binding protein